MCAFFFMVLHYFSLSLSLSFSLSLFFFFFLCHSPPFGDLIGGHLIQVSIDSHFALLHLYLRLILSLASLHEVLIRWYLSIFNRWPLLVHLYGHCAQLVRTSSPRIIVDRDIAV